MQLCFRYVVQLFNPGIPNSLRLKYTDRRPPAATCHICFVVRADDFCMILVIFHRCPGKGSTRSCSTSGTNDHLAVCLQTQGTAQYSDCSRKRKKNRDNALYNRAEQPRGSHTLILDAEGIVAFVPRLYCKLLISRPDTRCRPETTYSVLTSNSRRYPLVPGARTVGKEAFAPVYFAHVPHPSFLYSVKYESTLCGWVPWGGPAP